MLVSRKRANSSDDSDSDYGDDDFSTTERSSGTLKPILSRSNRNIVHRPPLANRLNLGYGGLKTSADSLSKPFKALTFSNQTNKMGGMKAGSTLGVTRRLNIARGALHDPEAEDAIVLYSPPQVEHGKQLEMIRMSVLDSESSHKVHVVVDPLLGKILRPHQIEGVRFLYECVTGQKAENAFGCIMADEMGLGKTLQCLALLWTLLRQSPNPGKSTIEKAVIACPSSLVRNWANEIKKWLGPDRIRPLACDMKGSKEQTTREIEQFAAAHGRSIVTPVLIISYESLRAYAPVLSKTEIGLMLCDEGHRLKNADSLTYRALNELNAKRRVILSGTPIQNDLSEYFALINFAIPGVLGNEAEFRKNFENPILKGRDALATDKERLKSEEKLQELLGIANKFIIRRTAELLTKYLPVKYEHVVFCKMTPVQLAIYNHFCSSKEIQALLRGVGSQPLKAITLLKKLCNHPALIEQGLFPNDLFPPNFDWRGLQPEMAGKMLLLDKMLTKMRKETKDKIVLISNYTQTLELFTNLCNARRWGCLRLDGSMSIPKRQKLVDEFNDPNSSAFIFLLSSKAGGCGLNLVGANRLVLFDPDWNPANDGQALARVWRDGQKKTCFIYRFIATGSIEEKIFQRQAHKQSLSSCVVDEAEDVERHFSADALRQLFTFNPDTVCDTHDTFKCRRCVHGRQVTKPPESDQGIKAGATAADTSTWNHFSNLELAKVHDNLLRECAAQTGIVSFVFQNKSHDQIVVRTK